MSQEQSSFKEGDAVQHKTGGPMMIYIGSDDLGRCICTWMAGAKKQSDTFHPAELKPYETDGSSFIGIRTI